MKKVIEIQKLPLDNTGKAEIKKWEEAREECHFNFPAVEKLEKEMIFELLECALFKIDALQYKFENGQRDAYDIIDELFAMHIEVLKMFYKD